jgi:DNA-binding MarR family transcriptional regulator
VLTNERSPVSSDSELTEVLSKVVELILAQRAKAIDLAAEKDISEALLAYVSKIAELHNPTMGELAKALDVSKPSATAAVERLNHLGYVQKVKSDEDRRVSHLHLRPEGEIFAKRYAGIHQTIAEKVQSRLSQRETAELCRLLQKVLGDS